VWVFYRVQPSASGVWFDFILSHFWKKKIFIVSTFVPNAIPGSNTETGQRFERIRLA
jgi:hypothetical protein